jgi:hypothetical protein
MSDDSAFVSASVAIDASCEIRKQFCDGDVTIWLESRSNSFNICIPDDGTAEMLRDIFAEAAEHFARVQARTDED